jgi:hypothetical protein
MALFHRKPPGHFIPIHGDNVRKKDWIILLEAATIVGTPRDKLRVAQTTLERKIVKRYSLSLKAQHFVVVDGYDPRIHALYFCPQLYRYDNDKLVPLQGEEIGTLIARALERGVVDRRPWYEPSERTPDQPIIDTPMQEEFDTVVVEMPVARNSPAAVVSESSTKGRGPAR